MAEKRTYVGRRKMRAPSPRAESAPVQVPVEVDNTPAMDAAPQVGADAPVAEKKEQDISADILDVLKTLGVDDVVAFRDTFDDARAQAKNDADAVLAERKVMSIPESLAVVEGKFDDEVMAIWDAFTRVRIGVAERGLKLVDAGKELGLKGLELVDLHTKEKAFAALVEIVPAMAIVYAVAGKRVEFREGKGIREPQLVDIDAMDRLLYLAGSVFFLGHVWTGVRHTLVKRGFFAAMKHMVMPSVARAQLYLIRQITVERVPASSQLPPPPAEGEKKP